MGTMKAIVCLSVLASLLLTTSAESAELAGNPFHFLYNKCLQPDDSGDIGLCARDLLRSALDRDRALFTTGVTVGNETIVLDPLTVPDVADKANKRPKWQLSGMKLTGLSAVHVDSVMLTERVAAALVSVPQLTAHLRLTVRVSFIPLRPRLALTLLSPRIMIGANWTATESGGLQLGKASARLWLKDYNCTVGGGASIGTSLQAVLNDNSQELIEFMTPSLEAAIVRKVESLTQEETDQGLAWLQKVLG